MNRSAALLGISSERAGSVDGLGFEALKWVLAIGALPIERSEDVAMRNIERPLWVRRTRYEYMSSALPSNSDITRRSRHFTFVPDSDSFTAANN